MARDFTIYKDVEVEVSLEDFSTADLQAELNDRYDRKDSDKRAIPVSEIKAFLKSRPDSETLLAEWERWQTEEPIGVTHLARWKAWAGAQG